MNTNQDGEEEDDTRSGDIYFIDELGNVVFPFVGEEQEEQEEECFFGEGATVGGTATGCSCAAFTSEGMSSPDLRRQSQVRAPSLGHEPSEVGEHGVHMMSALREG